MRQEGKYLPDAARTSQGRTRRTKNNDQKSVTRQGYLCE